MDDEDFSEHLAALGALEALPGAPCPRPNSLTSAKQAWRPSRRVLGVRGATPGPAVRAIGTTRLDRSCGRWLGLGDWGMGKIFALMRRRVRHGALTMRLRSHVRSAVKTASWRAFAAVDTFGLVWLFSGHDTTHAIAAAGAVVGVEAITKSFLYFAHERLWEAPLLR